MSAVSQNFSQQFEPPADLERENFSLNIEKLSASLKRSAESVVSGHLEDSRFCDYTETLTFGAEKLNSSTPVLTCISGIGSCYLSLLSGHELRELFLDAGGRVNYMTLPGHSGDWSELKSMNADLWDKGLSEKLLACSNYTTSAGVKKVTPQIVLTYSGSVPSVLKHELTYPGSIRAIIMLSPLFYLNPRYGIPLRVTGVEPARTISRLALKSLGTEEFSYSKVGFTVHDHEFLDITFRSISVDTLFQFVPVAQGGRTALSRLAKRSNGPRLYSLMGNLDASINPFRTKSFLESAGVTVKMFERSNHRLHVGDESSEAWQTTIEFAKETL